MTQIPSVGRIVHVRQVGNPNPCPAIITRVLADGTVNLRGLGERDTPEHFRNMTLHANEADAIKSVLPRWKEACERAKDRQKEIAEAQAENEARRKRGQEPQPCPAELNVPPAPWAAHWPPVVPQPKQTVPDVDGANKT